MKVRCEDVLLADLDLNQALQTCIHQSCADRGKVNETTLMRCLFQNLLCNFQICSI